jgi:C1A family cysteine protease
LIENATGDVYYLNENSSVNTINVDLTNYASPVRDQGACNSCYAHSTTATIELMLNINGILGMDLS